MTCAKTEGGGRVIDAETEMYMCCAFCISLLSAAGGILAARMIWAAAKAALFYAGERRQKDDPVF